MLKIQLLWLHVLAAVTQAAYDAGRAARTATRNQRKRAVATLRNKHLRLEDRLAKDMTTTSELIDIHEAMVERYKDQLVAQQQDLRDAQGHNLDEEQQLAEAVEKVGL